MITYLFGAGASCGALPIVNRIPQQLADVAKELEAISLSYDDRFERIPGGKQAEFYKECLCADLKWLSDEASKHASVDTLAKKMFLSGSTEQMLRLKGALAAFLSLKEAATPTDQRYDAFYASILKKSLGDFPSQIRIVSWNYDGQFEKSYKEFGGREDALNITSKYENFYSVKPGFHIYKLNGVAGYVEGREGPGRIFRYYSKALPLGQELVSEVCYHYAAGFSLSGRRTAISFAWEDSEYIRHVADQIENTSILVVIGYSFPFFNRDVDRALFSRASLRKVYYQSPDAKDLSERFLSVSPESDAIVPITNCDQFYLPNEL
jgi:hypothetical protein